MMSNSFWKDQLIDPRDLRYRISRHIRKLVDECLKKNDGSDESRQLQSLMDKEEENKNSFSYDDLTELHKNLQRLDPSYDLHFHQLITKTTVINPPARKDAQLENRIKMLKKNQADKEYRNMSAGMKLPSSKKSSVPEMSEVKRTRTLLTALFNGFIVICASFFFFFKAVEYTLPKPDVTIQVLVGIIASTIVAIAELYFFIRVM